MTRRRLNDDGTVELLSFSYFGTGDTEAAYQAEVQTIAAHNRLVLSQPPNAENDDDPRGGHREN